MSTSTKMNALLNELTKGDESLRDFPKKSKRSDGRAIYELIYVRK